jgi:hypothetical protein
MEWIPVFFESLRFDRHQRTPQMTLRLTGKTYSQFTKHCTPISLFARACLPLTSTTAGCIHLTIGVCVYYCSAYYKAVRGIVEDMCVFVTVVHVLE